MWIDLSDMPSDGVHVRLGLRDTDTRFETAHYQQPMEIVVDLLGLQGKRHHQVIRHPVLLSRRHDPDDCIKLIVNVDLAPYDIWSTAKFAYP